MPGSVAFQNQREFRCNHCSGKILVPKDLPPMTGPCPHCGSTITSPGPDDDKPPVQQVSAKVEVPAVVVKERVEVPAGAAPVETPKPAAAPPPLPASARPVAAPPTVPSASPVPEVRPVVAKRVEEAAQESIAAPPLPKVEPATVAPPVQVKAPQEPATPPPPVEAKTPVTPVTPPPPVEVKAPVTPVTPPPPVEVKTPVTPVTPPPPVEVKAPVAPVTPPPPVEVKAPVEPVAPPPPVETKAPIEPATRPEPVRVERAIEPAGVVSPNPPPEVVKVETPKTEPVREVIPPPVQKQPVVQIGLQESREPVQPPRKEQPVVSEALPAQKRDIPKTVVPPVVVAATHPVEPAKPAEPSPPRAQAVQSPVAPAPVEAAPQVVQAAAPPPAQPAPAKISIGLTEDAMASIRPAHSEPAPAAKPAVSQPAPAPVVPADSEIPPVPKKRRSENKPRKSIVAPMLVLLLLIILAGGGAVFYITTKMGRDGEKPSAVDPSVQAKIRQSQYSQSGWQDEAKQVLSSFLAADSSAGKAAFSIRGSELLPQMNDFYGNSPIDDSDTLLAGFASANLPAEDHKRGIFRMVYDQPPQFEMREFFRPLAPIEVQFGLQEPDLLLSSLAKASNFSSEPVKVEVFFKREPDGLKVDWETFVQTKYRTFRSFTELPDPGRSGIFRLFVMEDVPEKGRASQGSKTYRLADPAHKNDSARVEVPVDSELGRSLSILNWRGVKDARPVTKTVTLELEWTKEASPRLVVKRFICWEFLGIGGQAVGGGK